MSRGIQIFMFLFVFVPSLAFSQDSLNITQIGRLNEHGWANTRNLVIVDSLIYLVAGYCGLSIISIANPYFPEEVGFSTDLNHCNDLFNSGNYLYVTNGYSLRIVNIEDRIHPVIIGTCAIPGAWGVAVRDHYAFVTRNIGGLSVVDISDPINPVEVCFHAMSSYVYHMVLSGNYLYIANGGRGLCIMDVSDPINPLELSCCDTPGMAKDVAVVHDFAFVADDESGLQVIDISDSGNPHAIASMYSEGYALSVVVSGDTVYLAGGRGVIGGLRIVNISNPIQPQEIGHINTVTAAYCVAVQQGHAYLADDLAGLRVIDLSNPRSPVEIGFLDPLDYATCMVKNGDIIYVADGNGYLRTVYVQNPTHPRSLSNVFSTGFIVDMELSGNYLYAGGISPADFRIFDISTNAYIPRIISRWDSPSSVNGVAVAGNYAYLAAHMNGLRILDISDPYHPFEVAFWDSSEYTLFNDVCINENIAYVASYQGLRLFEVSDPSAPTLIGSINTRPAEHVEVIGNYAYLLRKSVSQDSLYCIFAIYNISNPNEIIETGAIRLRGDVESFSINSHYAFIATSWGGIHVINISDPYHPTRTGFYYSTDDYSHIVTDIIYEDGILYATEAMNLCVYNCSAATGISSRATSFPNQFVLWPAYPNPFNSTTIFRLDLPMIVKGRLVVYDLLGRHIATLLDGTLQAGLHEVNFIGNGLSSGSYFVRFESPDYNASQKIILLK